MKKSEQVLLHAPTKRLQGFVDRLCADLTDSLIVQLTDVALWCSWRGWSPALTRFDEEVAFPLPIDRAQVVRDAGRVAWKAIVSSSLQTEFKKWRTAQLERYASAAALGLVHPDGRLDDLEFDRMVVDRTLLHMFEADGIDVFAAAATAAGGPHAGAEVFLPELILVRHHDDYTYITHDGLAPPTISMPFPLGPGSYSADINQRRMQSLPPVSAMHDIQVEYLPGTTGSRIIYCGAQMLCMPGDYAKPNPWVTRPTTLCGALPSWTPRPSRHSTIWRRSPHKSATSRQR